MRETARPEVKRRRKFPAVVASVAAVPEPRVADKYYAQEKTCRMVEMGIRIEGCLGEFTPRGNEVACSPACRDALERYNNKKSEKKNKHKHRARINAREREREAQKRGPLLGRPCQGPGCPKTYYSRKPNQAFCSKRCKMKHNNAVRKQRRQEQPQPKKVKYCEAPHPTIPGKLCGKKLLVGKGNGRQVYCSLDCMKRARRAKGW